jgi:hypothetical protein
MPLILATVLMLGVFPQWREYVAEVSTILALGVVSRVLARVLSARIPRSAPAGLTAFDVARRVPVILVTASPRRARAAWLLSSVGDRTAAAEMAATLEAALPPDPQRADDLVAALSDARRLAALVVGLAGGAAVERHPR